MQENPIAKPRSKSGESETKPNAPRLAWGRLTWGNLKNWARSLNVTRGQAYQQGGRIKYLAVTGDLGLLATVIGSDGYATIVTLKQRGKT